MVQLGIIEQHYVLNHSVTLAGPQDPLTARHSHRQKNTENRATHISPEQDSYYWIEVRGSNARTGKRFLSSPKRRDRLWGPPSLLFNEYQGSFLGWVGRNVMFTNHLHLAPSLSISAVIPLLHLYAFMACTGTAFTFNSTESYVWSSLYLTRA